MNEQTQPASETDQKSHTDWFQKGLMALTILVGLAGVALLVYSFIPAPTPPIPKLHSHSGPTAAIIDQLGRGFPNPKFVAEATKMLEGAGYNVVYVPAEDVTVDFFRYLPAQDLDIILLRGHASASAINDDGETVTEDSVSLSTFEPVSDKYATERNARRIGAFEPEGEDGLYFSVRWDFFKYDAVGDFDNAVIVMMGCEGLRANKTAQIFLDRGAQAVVGWSNLVTADHMDKATLHMLEQWLENDKNLVEAVADTRLNVGYDPHFTTTELQILQ